jgi:hypothetical protein
MKGEQSLVQQGAECLPRLWQSKCEGTQVRQRVYDAIGAPGLLLHWYKELVEELPLQH